MRCSIMRHDQRYDESLAALRAELLVAETWLPDDMADSLIRETMISQLRSVFPYFDQHLLIVDSPHDGLPLDDYRSGHLEKVPRMRLRPFGGHVHAEPTDSLIQWPLTGWSGLSHEPLYGPLERLFIVSPTVLPAVGIEGELLSAKAVAHLVTKKNPHKSELRKEMWLQRP